MLFDPSLFDAEAGVAPALAGMKSAGTFAGGARPSFGGLGRIPFAGRRPRPFARTRT
jgi:hypothetical protein